MKPWGFFMAFQNLQNFLFIIIQTVGIVILLEAVVIYFFKIKRFWPALGVISLINLLSFGLLFLAAILPGKLGYELNGLHLPLPVMVFFWWVSVMADGLLLQLIAPRAEKQTVYLASTLMNTASFLFLYFFVINS